MTVSVSAEACGTAGSSSSLFNIVIVTLSLSVSLLTPAVNNNCRSCRMAGFSHSRESGRLQGLILKPPSGTLPAPGHTVEERCVCTTSIRQ